MGNPIRKRMTLSRALFLMVIFLISCNAQPTSGSTGSPKSSRPTPAPVESPQEKHASCNGTTDLLVVFLWQTRAIPVFYNTNSTAFPLSGPAYSIQNKDWVLGLVVDLPPVQCSTSPRSGCALVHRPHVLLRGGWAQVRAARFQRPPRRVRFNAGI
jgi:hypothetical protein